MRCRVISFEQPAGRFLCSVMPARELVAIAKPNPRSFDAERLETVGGIQRHASTERIREIAEYSNTVDAAFPTPILLALAEGSYTLENDYIEVSGSQVADVVDGQHRLYGLQQSSQLEEFELPVVFLLQPTDEQKALIFATINGKQTKVPASLVYDLFGVTEGRSPQKTAHEVARAINSTVTSPWFRRLKMLGRKTPGSDETLSQGTFVKQLLPMISARPDLDADRIKRGEDVPDDPERVFNGYFRKKEDAIILRVLVNYFQAARETWPHEWDVPVPHILTKTTGFNGLMKALPDLVKRGKAEKNLSVEAFKPVFDRAMRAMRAESATLTVDHFPAGTTGENRLRDFVLMAFRSGDWVAG